jgi:hypothetical protein
MTEAFGLLWLDRLSKMNRDAVDDYAVVIRQFAHQIVKGHGWADHAAEKHLLPSETAHVSCVRASVSVE